MPDITPIPIRSFDRDEPAASEEPPADAPRAEREAAAGSPPTEPVGSLASALAEMVAGIVVVATQALDDAVGPDDETSRLLHAGAGLLIEAARAAGTLAATLERSAVDLARSPSGMPVVDHWEAIWRDRVAEDGDRDRTSEAIDGVLTRIDLTGIVRRNLDLNAIVEDLDPDPIVARMDMDALTDRIDIDALAARIDVDELIGRLDLTAIASAVIEELDIAELIRQASAETTSDEVKRLRLRSVDADRAIQRAVDTVLRRRDDG